MKKELDIRIRKHHGQLKRTKKNYKKHPTQGRYKTIQEYEQIILELELIRNLLYGVSLTKYTKYKRICFRDLRSLFQRYELGHLLVGGMK